MGQAKARGSYDERKAHPHPISKTSDSPTRRKYLLGPWRFRAKRTTPGSPYVAGTHPPVPETRGGRDLPTRVVRA
jgi:hypothetical protein